MYRDDVEAQAGVALLNSHRRRDLVELAVAYGLILAVCWTPNPVQEALYWVAFAWVTGISFAARPDWKEMGLGLRGSLRSLWLLAIALALSALSFLVAARLHTLHRLYGHPPVWFHASGYFVWAILQQFILQDVVLLRLLRLTASKRRAVAAAAVLFALAHLPNPLLTVLALAWGAVACLLFLRYRGLFTLGLVHGLLGLCVAMTVPNAVHHHMRVGLGYLTYRQPERRIGREKRLNPAAQARFVRGAAIKRINEGRGTRGYRPRHG